MSKCATHSYRAALELIARGYEGPVGNCEGLSGTRCAEIAKDALSHNGPNGELLAALQDARDALYNGFEPDNQSYAWHRADAIIKRHCSATGCRTSKEG